MDKKKPARIWSTRAPWVKIYGGSSSSSSSPSPVAPMKLKSGLEDLGQYITNEYGLLKQVLSYLKPAELWNVRRVCRKWRDTVDLLVNNNPVVVTHARNEKCLDPSLVKRMIPTLVIHQKVRKNDRASNSCDICEQIYYVCPCSISTPHTGFISIESDTKYHRNGERLSLYKFVDNFATLIMPSSEEIRVSSFCIMKKAKLLKQPVVTEQTVTRCVRGEEPIKCLLVFSKIRELNRFISPDFVSSVLNEVVKRQGRTFACGGGEVMRFRCALGSKFPTKYNHRTRKNNWVSPAYIFIAFRGESVSAHSEILFHRTADQIEASMKKLAEKVGPVPEGGTRVAFIAQCIARTEDKSMALIESRAFNNAFPSVPQFGFVGYGEYGMTSSSTTEDQVESTSKKMKINFEHSNSTSFTIITFNKVRFNK